MAVCFEVEEGISSSRAHAYVWCIPKLFEAYLGYELKFVDTGIDVGYIIDYGDMPNL